MKRTITTLLFALLCAAASAQGLGAGGIIWLGGSGGSATISNDDEFNASVLSAPWGWMPGREGDIGLTGTALRITSGKGNTWDTSFNPTGLAQAIAGDFTARAHFSFTPTLNYQIAGMMVGFGPHTTQLGLVHNDAGAAHVTWETMDRVDLVSNKRNSVTDVTATNTLEIKCQRSGANVNWWYSEDSGSNWTSWDTTTRATFNATAPVLLTLFCQQDTINAGTRTSALFDWLRITRP
jgi:hypothetical protein